MANQKGRCRLKRWVSFLFAAVFMTEGIQAGALGPEAGVQADRSVSVEAGSRRGFQLNYKVWSEDWVNRAAEPCDVVLLLDASGGMNERSSGEGEKTWLECLQKGTETFLRELSQVSPDSRAGVLVLGETVRRAGLSALNSRGVDELLSTVSGVEQGKGDPINYAEALEQAEKLMEEGKAGGSRPLYLITVTSGLWAGEEKAVLPKLQSLRDKGVKSYVALLRASAEEETVDFWQSMSSAPLSTHYYLCAGEAESCLGRIRRDIASVLSVEVVQRLDPRFELPSDERERLRDQGAHLDLEKNGAWVISWEADLPRQKNAPWTASLTVQAKEAFPGGNDIAIDGEETGIYRAGEKISSLPELTVNVPLNLDLTDLESPLFLGERVRITADGKTIEERMQKSPEPDWFGKGKTGSFSWLWETAQGDSVGSLKQLESQTPEKDVSYRLSVSYRPGSDGLSSVGTPVKAVEKTALYKIKVTGGTVRLTAAANGETVPKTAFVLFRLDRENGQTFFCTILPEADPESGIVSLEGEIKDLPYGTYTATPVFWNGAAPVEAHQRFRLGVWEKDDTVSVERSFAEARFTLKSGDGAKTE